MTRAIAYAAARVRVYACETSPELGGVTRNARAKASLFNGHLLLILFAATHHTHRDPPSISKQPDTVSSTTLSEPDRSCLRACFYTVYATLLPVPYLYLCLTSAIFHACVDNP